jgi:hypothetical protein
MKKSLILLLALMVTGLLALAVAVNVTGDWEMTTVTQRGEMKTQLKFVQEGEKLTVTQTRIGRDGTPQETKGEGTVKGNDIEWKIVRQGPQGEMTTTYKGQIVDENNLKGTMEGGFGGGGGQAPEWKAVRKPK